MEHHWQRLNRARYVKKAPYNFENNLRLLNDVLGQTEFRDKYWLIGGLLVGWARERALLRWDAWDADFAYLHQDRAAFQAAGEQLIQNGFQFNKHWYNSAGIRTQSVFFRNHAKFEFWEMTSQADAFQYFMYGTRKRVTYEARCVNPAYGLEPILFLKRRWLKPADHDSMLTSVYGDWRVPQANWDYLRDQKDIVEMYRWRGHWGKTFDDKTICTR